MPTSTHLENFLNKKSSRFSTQARQASSILQDTTREKEMRVLLGVTCLPVHLSRDLSIYGTTYYFMCMWAYVVGISHSPQK
jgi:hypothetical protein